MNFESKTFEQIYEEVSRFTINDLLLKERRAGVFGPFHVQKFLEKAPERAKRHLEMSKKFPWNAILNTRQGFEGMDVNDFPPASFAAIASTVTATQLWTQAIWTPIAANDMRAGKVYVVEFGGIISNTATPTVIFTPCVGTSATLASNISLGASPTVTTVTGLSSSPFYGEFIMGVRALGLAASGATVTGNGYVILGNVSAASTPIVMGGGILTNVDNTTAQALAVFLTWGTSSPSNTLTCQWALIKSYN